MTAPTSPDYTNPHPLSLGRGNRAAAWLTLNAGTLRVVGAAVAVGVAGVFAYRWNQAGKTQRAEAAFYQAQATAAAAGDPRQIEKALSDVATRYAGTPAGAQAQLLLAQTLYDGGRFQDGLTALKRGTPPAEFADAVQLLTAAGYEGMGRGADAARLYEAAAGRPDLAPRRRDDLLAAAARAYTLSNDRDSAQRLWRRLAESGQPGLRDEARTRLGELATAGRG